MDNWERICCTIYFLQMREVLSVFIGNRDAYYVKLTTYHLESNQPFKKCGMQYSDLISIKTSLGNHAAV